MSIPDIEAIDRLSAPSFKTITKSLTIVRFKDGKRITLSGAPDRKEVVYQAFLQRALDDGLSVDQAEALAKTKYPKPLRRSA